MKKKDRHFISKLRATNMLSSVYMQYTLSFYISYEFTFTRLTGYF